MNWKFLMVLGLGIVGVLGDEEELQPFFQLDGVEATTECTTTGSPTTKRSTTVTTPITTTPSTTTTTTLKPSTTTTTLKPNTTTISTTTKSSEINSNITVKLPFFKRVAKHVKIMLHLEANSDD
ncbi:unnamed protein product [Caenorhabditis angaria]|uniref:Integumentary mucin C.1-like n=1 Tax=Caenorhabditis angaria TaxID=860376 RepID=A0A9P1MWT3_9PELO|nr:unnamed protein product [Caenorhabditis angaria]